MTNIIIANGFDRLIELRELYNNIGPVSRIYHHKTITLDFVLKSVRADYLELAQLRREKLANAQINHPTAP